MSNIILIDDDGEEIDHRYENGKVYGLYRKDTDELIYVGSTIQPLNIRFSVHKSNCKGNCGKDTNIKVYKYIKEEKCLDYLEIRLIQKFPCRNKKELLFRESHYTCELKPICNVRVEGRTQKEYYIEHKEEIALKNKIMNAVLKILVEL
jgi:hypothetical protein